MNQEEKSELFEYVFDWIHFGYQPNSVVNIYYLKRSVAHVNAQQVLSNKK